MHHRAGVRLRRTSMMLTMAVSNQEVAWMLMWKAVLVDARALQNASSIS